MQSEMTDPKTAIKQLKVIYFSLIGGVIIFPVLLMELTWEKLFFKVDFTDVFVIPIVILMFIGIPLGYLYFRRAISNLNPDLPVKDKMAVYVPAFLVKVATCEGVCLLTTVCALISTNMFYMLFFLITFAVMLSYYPAVTKVGDELGLHPSEIDEIS
jgi:hypothetical protein